VVTTPFSFIASSNVIKMVGRRRCLRISTQDAEPGCAKAEQALTAKTKAILGVEAFGNPIGMHELAQLAARQ